MNRRAQLQRKLAIAPVPKPPADLAKRIKSEIPEKLRLDNEAERERLSESIALNLRVAASILVLISTAFLALHLFSRANEQPTTTVALKRVAAPAVLTSSAADNVVAAPTQTVAQPQAIVAPAAAPAQGHVRAQRQIAAVEKKNVEETPRMVPAEDVARALPPPPVPAPPPAAPAANAESITITASAPAVAAKAASNAPTGDATLQRYAVPDSLPARFALDVEAVENPFESGKALVRASTDWGKTASVRLDVIPSEGPASHWGSSRYTNGSHTMVVDLPPAQSLTIRGTYTQGDEPEQVTGTVITASDVKPWSDASRRTKAAVLAWLWKHGADAQAVAAKAREAGLEDLAREIER